ncbi:MAG: hypothetical protein WBV36_14655 [Terriglobales bacterium]
MALALATDAGRPCSMAKADVIYGADLRNVDEKGIENHAILVSTDISFARSGIHGVSLGEKSPTLLWNHDTTYRAWTRGWAGSGVRVA